MSSISVEWLLDMTHFNAIKSNASELFPRIWQSFNTTYVFGFLMSNDLNDPCQILDLTQFTHHLPPTNQDSPHRSWLSGHNSPKHFMLHLQRHLRAVKFMTPRHTVQKLGPQNWQLSNQVVGLPILHEILLSAHFCARLARRIWHFWMRLSGATWTCSMCPFYFVGLWHCFFGLEFFKLAGWLAMSSIPIFTGG